MACVGRYSVNAIINEATKPTEVTFFSEGMAVLCPPQDKLRRPYNKAQLHQS
ncbi:hypothetical protein HanXRQr2_Chr17g0804841 [Helianthus annuus]|uniref:Uncharacterized protein n=1 Tax=Helianthus annuus TaxID=4232 RepID=A0A9K3GVC9_HELAN|nr:hypothetical protein HanXRQr2_Chr17g0804841 [Helianthus annuus]KAJ0813459.1 hypothetical protein HanPSC8_Chr17g0773661 [Helianthus annuus]